MILLLFFAISLLMGVSVILARDKTITIIITSGYALLHIFFTIYCWINLNRTELDYFTYNSPGVLLLSVLSVITIPTIYHGFIYASRDDVKK